MLQGSVLQQLKSSNSEYIEKNVDSILDAILQKLERKENTFCDLVESLQSLLTDGSPSKRALGTQVLVDVINTPSNIKISTEELKFLAAFFVDRLKDHYLTIPHVLVGILALVKMENIHDEDVKLLMTRIFQESHFQTLPMAERRNIYLFLKFCVNNKYEVVKGMCTEFVLGFINLVEGEKDPRNLAILFSFIPQIAQMCPENFAEDLFELLAAYFPIDFVPPANDPFGVSSDDLVLGLRRCLSSTDAFAAYCLPLLKEKLDSDLVPSKVEALLTLQACLMTYSPLSICRQSMFLWESLKRELLNNWNTAIKVQAEEALKFLLRALEAGSSSQSVKETLLRLGEDVMIESGSHLSFADQSMTMNPSTNLLLTICSHSKILSEKISKKVLPILLDQFRTSTTPSARQNILFYLSKLISETFEWEKIEESCLEHRVSSVDLFIESLGSSSSMLVETSVSGLGLIASALTDSQRLLASRNLVQIHIQSCDMKSGSNNSSLRSLTIKTLISLENHNPNILLEVVMPELLLSLDGDNKGDGFKQQILSSISDLCVNEVSVRLVLPLLWNRAITLVANSEKEQCIQTLKCVHKIVDGAYNFSNGSCVKYICLEWNGVLKCHHLAFKVANANLLDDSVPILQQISEICQCCFHRDNFKMLENLINLTLGLQNTLTVSEYDEGFSAANFEAVIKLSNINPAFLVYCVEGMTLSDPSSLLKFKNCSDILNCLKRLGLTATDVRVQGVAARLHGAHILKIESVNQVFLHLQTLERDFPNSLFCTENSELMTASVVFLGWIVKSLIMRGYAEDIPWIEKLESLLLNRKLAQTASDCYSFLIKDTPKLFSSRNIPKTCRMLYKQRFFERRIDVLINQFNSVEGKGRIPTLMALSHILGEVPQNALKGHLKKLIPLLLQGLTLEDPSVTCGAVDTLSSLLPHSHDAVTPHASSLISPLLELAVTSSLNVRVKSIQCLEALSLLPPATIMPLKQKVIQGLKTPLGDRKRVVRQAAANARSSWVIL